MTWRREARAARHGRNPCPSGQGGSQETASTIALEAHRTGRPALELVRERRLLTDEQLGALTTPQALTGGPVG
ncbi:hypothetical protein AB0I53_38700 [Saccharopolyspora sp. NPDC050389]|uniref:hypothetical protein n=1 Tax=Saccharopolyspora sp. NPDC050389 TaxID=3155516 RepID=UPI0034058E9C